MTFFLSDDMLRLKLKSRIILFTKMTALLLASLLCSCDSNLNLIYRTQQLIIDINQCLGTLDLDNPVGCGVYYEASTEGCFVIKNEVGVTHKLPIRITEEGVVPINGEDDLLGQLSFDQSSGGLFSIFLFSSTHNEASQRCDLLNTDSLCDGDCAIAVREHPLMITEQANVLNINASMCQWVPATQELREVLCDAIDNDCDGQVDENMNDLDAPKVGEMCSRGTGACESVSTIQCLDGIGQPPTCAAVPKNSGVEICDEIDNDCDDEIDEDFDLGGICYVYEGTECKTEGIIACQITNGEEGEPSSETYCSTGNFDPLSLVTNSELGGECDGLDNDCDGVTDEHFIPQVAECGMGSCSDQAVTSCRDNQIMNLCREGTPDGIDDNCNGIDDDCDGEADEMYLAEIISCGLGVCEANGPQLCRDGQVDNLCIDRNPLGEDDDCDGIDQDCDGTLDEHYEEERVMCGVGACLKEGERSCIRSQIENNCVPGNPTSDYQCNNIDEDCDGRIDEAYLSRTTSCGQGVCRATGSTYCSQGIEVDSCIPSSNLSTNDVCNGLDYDCDGRVDEGHSQDETMCGVGVCESVGVLLCSSGVIIDSCVVGQPANGDNDSTCDGLDSDCDGRIDEGFEGAEVSCGDGSCAATGVRTCINGDDSGDTCVVGMPALNDPSCDGIDQDCDGNIDENYVSHRTNCGIGVCRRRGDSSCVNGFEESGCVPGNPVGGDSSCDGLDADCDGRFDEGYQSSVTTCGLGVCQGNGQLKCEAGSVVDTCQVGLISSEDQQCDGVDQDCDGQVDEHYISTRTDCGLGICRGDGNLVCTPGGLVDTCVDQDPIDQDTRCDGLDTDCDGETDEGFSTQQISCGTGACIENGQTRCVNGEVIEDCQPNQNTSPDNNCNLVDDDCDGNVDESYPDPPPNVTCQANACFGEGEIICTNNGPVNTCTVDDSGAIDDTCDGVDQDCDGDIDENYTPPSTGVVVSCGIGACLNNNGVLACDGGSVVTICMPNPETGDDSDCDGIDDDCDNKIDEDYSSTSTCGVGACYREIPNACINGQVINLCVPGDPAPYDNCGSGLDDNCDGTVANFPINTPCTAQNGTCSNSGVYQCNSDLSDVVCSATPPPSNPEVCDLVDNDCDGPVDEEIQFSPPECVAIDAVGACQQGTLICLDGMIGCQDGSSNPEISCNDEDEDCDGFTDEEFVNGQRRRKGRSCPGAGCKWRCHANETELTCRKNNGDLCQ